jgi:hypothetical protein
MEKINIFRAAIRDPNMPKNKEQFALRFRVLYANAMSISSYICNNHDRGGNDTEIRFFDKGTNTHKLWDTDLVEWNTRNEDVWLNELGPLVTRETAQDASGGTVEDWATESLLTARKAYDGPGTGQRIKPGQKLAREYFDQNLPVVRERMYQAGVRLAEVLNWCFEQGDNARTDS